ncbi:stress response translation initiation inhibitor YciH [Congregibacter brevis]|uniref:Stress response translation initiation inhibitor YciH n=1 Tax=Congregibacter brevis TaxID=3081201 RepID=A0ABZ0IB75_9GAMM|nr:stress response translation initiation inhibitor YciH [Congregibacter sp. IMCC45268]
MSRSGAGKSRPVYSTDKGRLCPDCGVVKADCRCRLLKAAASQGDGIVRLKRETKGRGGKAVTLVTGLPDDSAALKKRAKVLKQRCGVGGAIKDGVIEIQGDQRELIKSLLEADGLTVKIAGG